jgi:hypothetical protein
MFALSIVNLESCFDCRTLEHALNVAYDNDARPYGIWVLEDPNKSRIHVRLETNSALGELSMSIKRTEIATTDELIRAVVQSIESMLDEVEACTR